MVLCRKEKLLQNKGLFKFLKDIARCPLTMYCIWCLFTLFLLLLLLQLCAAVCSLAGPHGTFSLISFSLISPPESFIRDAYRTLISFYTCINLELLKSNEDRSWWVNAPSPVSFFRWAIVRYSLCNSSEGPRGIQPQLSTKVVTSWKRLPWIHFPFPLCTPLLLFPSQALLSGRTSTNTGTD